MASWTIVLPCRPDEAQMWTELGLTDLPEDASAPASVEQVRQLLQAQGWLFDEETDEHDGEPILSFWARRRADGAWPPFSCIDVWPDHFSVRHGGYTCWLLAVGASATCGPLVAWAESGAGPVLCTPATTYEQFASAFGYEGDAERDGAWALPD